MQCHELRHIADSYLGDELLVETNHEIISHLESCAACRGELAARRVLRARLRQAILNAPELQMRPEFAASLRAQVRGNANRKNLFGAFNVRPAWLAAAACLVIAGAFALRTIQNRHDPATPSRQIADLGQKSSSEKEAKFQPTPAVDADVAVRASLAGMTKGAAGDHRNCAVEFRLARQPIALEEAAKKYDQAYVGLTDAVMQGGREFAEQTTLVKAHSCVFENRRFGHIILKHQGRLVSVLVTALDGAKGVPAGLIDSANEVNGIVAACGQVGEYQVSCFRTGGHAVFVVSDLSEKENLKLARALAPLLYEHMASAEMKAAGEV